MNEPTSEQCSANVRLADVDGLPAYACWYPQMGGYVGRCVLVLHANGCFEAYVWHDGTFPFSEDRQYGGEASQPAHIHHCCAEQFIEFGQTVIRLQGD